MRRTTTALLAGATLFTADACGGDGGERDPSVTPEAVTTTTSTVPVEADAPVTIDFSRQGHIPDNAWQQVPLSHDEVCDVGVEFDGSSPEGAASVARDDLVGLPGVGIVWSESDEHGAHAEYGPVVGGTINAAPRDGYEDFTVGVGGPMCVAVATNGGSALILTVPTPADVTGLRPKF